MRKLAFLLLLATITIGLSAEGYTLEQLIEYGMNNASSIAKSELNKDSAYSNHLSSWLDFLPDAGISYNRFKNETSESESASYTISKAISLNEGEYFQFRNTQLERTAADLSLESTKKNLAYTILESYLTILQNQKELEIQQENLALQDKMFQEISLQVKQGRKTAIDQNQTEIDKIDSQIQIDNLSNSIMDMRADLFAMLKMDDNGEPFSEVTLSINSIDALPSVKSISPDNNDNPFSFKIDYLNLKKMKINEWQNKLSFLPSITFSASYDQVSTVDQVSEFDNYNESYSFGVSASYSLWNIFNEGERYRRYRNNLKSTEIDLQDRIDDFNNQYDKLLRELNFLHRSKDLYERKLAQSSENLSVSTEKYNLGLIDLIELDRSRISNLQARISLNQNYYNILKKQEQLNQLLSAPIMNRW